MAPRHGYSSFVFTLLGLNQCLSVPKPNETKRPLFTGRLGSLLVGQPFKSEILQTSKVLLTSEDKSSNQDQEEFKEEEENLEVCCYEIVNYTW